MGMTLAEMRKRLRFIITEPSEDRFVNTDDATKGLGLDSLLNDGLKAYFADTRWATSVWYIAVTGSDTYSNDNRIYSLPADCLEVDKDDVSFNKVKIFETTRKELWAEDKFSGVNGESEDSEKWPEGVGTPKHFYFEKEDVIGLKPTPNAAANGKTLKFSGVEAPDTLSLDESEAPLPYDLAKGAVHWAAREVFINDGEDVKAANQESLYNKYVARGRERKRTRQREKPIGIAQSNHYYVDPQEVH